MNMAPRKLLDEHSDVHLSHEPGLFDWSFSPPASSIEDVVAGRFADRPATI
jgi:hypothetical protein